MLFEVVLSLEPVKWTFAGKYMMYQQGSIKAKKLAKVFCILALESILVVPAFIKLGTDSVTMPFSSFHHR